MTDFKTRLILGAGLALSAALPAAAQTGLCGGAGDNGQWIGGTESASDVSVAPAAMEQMALVLMRNEYVALFTVSAGTDVRVEAEGRGVGDPVIDLRDSTGNIILSDDDSGGNGASRGELFLDPGTYCLSMKSYDGSPMTGFVRVGRLEHEALTEGLGFGGPNDTFVPDDHDYGSFGYCDVASLTNYLSDAPIDTTAGVPGVSGTASANDVPAWGFTLAAPGAITITATNEIADPIIALYDASGNWLAENDDYDGLNSRIEMTSALPAGTYCISVDAYSDATQPITVTVGGYDPNAQLIGMYDRGEASPPTDGSYPITDIGTLTNRYRQDAQVGGTTIWYSVDIAEASLLLVEAVASGQGDPMIVLYDDFGRLVTENDDYGGSFDALVAARVLPGTYLVGVRQYGQPGSASLIRVLFERYVAAN